MTSSYRDRENVYRVPTPGRIRSREHRMHLGCLGAVLATLAILALAFWGFMNYEFGTEHHETFTITRLDDQAAGSSGHKYLIFGTLPDGRQEVYEDTDAPFHGKWNSSDLFASLTVGETVNCDLYGWRNHVLSSYKDLLSCTKA